MQFRRLGDPLQRVRVPGLQCRNEEDLFEQCDVALPGLVADIDAAAELRVVDQLPGMLRQEADEFRQLRQLLDVSDIPQVAGEDRGQIGPRPILAPPLALAADRFGKAADEHELDEILADDRRLVALQLAVEQAFQESRRLAGHLGAGQRQHLDGFHPAGQTVGDARQREHVRGAGQQEAAGAIVLVHGFLDRQQQIGRALDLIDDRLVQSANEAHRIGLCGVERRLVVEGDVGPPGLSHLPHQRRLAGAARADDQHHRGVRKGFLRPPLHKPLVHADSMSQKIGTMGHDNWKSRK